MMQMPIKFNVNRKTLIEKFFAWLNNKMIVLRFGNVFGQGKYCTEYVKVCNAWSICFNFNNGYVAKLLLIPNRYGFGNDYCSIELFDKYAEWIDSKLITSYSEHGNTIVEKKYVPEILEKIKNLPCD